MDFQQKASFGDKVKFSDNWIKVVGQATYARIKRDNTEFRRCIDTLISILLKKEREKAKKYLDEFKRLNPNADINQIYFEVLTYIIDLLQEGGYLTKSTTMELGGSMSNEPEERKEDEEPMGDEQL